MNLVLFHALNHDSDLFVRRDMSRWAAVSIHK
jgi:hypothetical protein